MRPLKDGVIRPERDARVDATEGGLDDMPCTTVGIDNLEYATKTPHFGGQEKYCFLEISYEHLQEHRKTKNTPFYRSIVFPFACESTTEFNTCPSTLLAVNLA